MNQQINLFILNITLTLRCTLRCKLCAADVTKYKIKPHYSREYIEDVIDHCFYIVDRVERFQLSGGEPLLHENFPEILEKAYSYSNRFGMLGIFSNGTIVPNNNTIQVIKAHPDVDTKFYLSHYGELSNKIDEIIAVLSKNNIPYEVKVYHGENQHFDGWIDYGDYQYQNYSEERLCQIFRECAVNKIGGIWSCRYGQLHRCTRSASGMDLGRIPMDESNYIDLFDRNPLEAQREKLLTLMRKPFLTACKYCSGDFGSDDKTKRYPAAQQICEDV